MSIVVAVCAGAAAYQWFTWPDVRRLTRERPASTAFIEQFREQQRAGGGSDRVAWQWIPDAAISPGIKRAVLAGEDIGFYSHHGFEPAEMRQALWDAVRAWRPPRGASTITQQLAKNLWLSPSRNPLRKVKEALLTRQLESTLSKDRILEIYLNVVEFGPAIYGVEAASQSYFGKPANDLTAYEAALLAAALPSPRTWNPRTPTDGYVRQVQRIEERLKRATFLRDRIPERARKIPEPLPAGPPPPLAP